MQCWYYRNIKVRYLIYQMDLALDMTEDENMKDIYEVDLHSAMLAWKRI